MPNNYTYAELEKLASRIKCLVIGDIMLDQYVYGTVERVSPEAPIPVVSVSNTEKLLGGAANVAANISALGVQTSLCGHLGDDNSRLEVEQLMEKANLSFCGFIDNNHPTTIKTRVIAKHQQIVRFDEETTVLLSEDTLKSIAELIVSKGFSVIVLSDYNKGFCSDELCRTVLDIARQRNIPVIVDPKTPDWRKYKGAYLITPNYGEFCQAIGKKSVSDAELIGSAHSLREKFEIDNIIVTMSERGMQYVGREKEFRISAEVRDVADVSGAGDTAIAALAAFLLAGLPAEDAVALANKAAGLAVGRVGTSVISLKELVDSCCKQYAQKTMGFESKIFSIDEISSFIAEKKERGGKIVFTNGCFDILHPGHVSYLESAKSLGDTLVVGVNSDNAVRELKGNDRPVNNEVYRSLILAALASTDAIVVFDSVSPEGVISIIRPDVLVKGGDWAVGDILGKEYAKETVILPFKEGYSTTKVIEKCKESK